MSDQQPSGQLAGVTEVAAALAAVYRHERVVSPQLRRLTRAIADLGLPLPSDWARADGDPDDPATMVSFGALSLRTLDHLVRVLEDVAANRPVEITIVQGGPTLFGPAAPPPPAPVPPTSDVHMRVGR